MYSTIATIHKQCRIIMCWWEIKTCEYTMEFQTSNFNSETPPDSKITSHCSHWYLFKLRPLRKRIYPFYPLDPSKQRFRNILSNCFFCKRQNAKSVQPHMANLSNIHLQLNVKPFSKTGVDYFGPIQAKSSRKTRRNQRNLRSHFHMS